MQRLKGRAALVTGAGQGIGRGVARRFAREGANVLVAELDEKSGSACADEIAAEFGIRSLFVRTDVGVREQVVGAVERTVAEFGSVDILVNNAWGGGTTSRLEYKTEAAMEHGFRVGLMSSFWAMQAAFPHMKANGYGRIVNLCSLNGINAHIGTLEYNAAKEALRTLTRTAAREWAPHGIVANVVCPGAKTAAFRRVAAENPQIEAMADAMNPMGRLGDPDDDIAPVAVFLASDDVRYLTGNTLFVDGGSHINGSPWAPELPESP